MKLNFVAGKRASYGILALKPFLNVEHYHKGDLAGNCSFDQSRLPVGISIAADPDYGISFEKK